MRKQYIQDETSCLENPTILFEKEHLKLGKIIVYDKKEKEGKTYKNLVFFVKTKSFGYFEMRHIINNQLMNRFEKTICGVGYLGNAIGNKHKREKSIWLNMISRCYNKKNKRYSAYGEKGIIVSERWKCFEYFLNDFKKIKGYNEEEFLKGNIQLDKDKNKGKIYSLENCEFITQKENMQYTSRMRNVKAVLITDGTIHLSNNQQTLSKITGVPAKKINEILRGKRKTYNKWTFLYNDIENII